VIKGDLIYHTVENSFWMEHCIRESKGRLRFGSYNATVYF